MELSRVGGPVLLSVPAAFRQMSAGRWAMSSDIPLRDTAPGDYLVTLRLTVSSGPATQLTRRFLIPNR